MNPRIILLLGATALKHMIPARKNHAMGSEVGRFFKDPAYPEADLMALYHPAYLLRDPRKQPLMVEHLRKFIACWKGLSA